MIGGVLGFLPILGFWMFPLGFALVAFDIPWTKHLIEDWMARKEQEFAKLQVDDMPTQ